MPETAPAELGLARLPVGFRKTSLVDYPAKVASVLFFPGCNFRCPWCHNPELVLGGKEDLFPLDACMAEIGRRRSLIQGVAITGGEPLLREDLGEVIRRLHAMGLAVKLDTNGSLPERLATLLASPETRPNYLALDLKTGSAGYQGLAEFPGAEPFPAVRASLRLVVGAGIPFELRTVVAPGYMDETIVAELAAIVPEDAPWFFSPFAPGNCLNPAWDDISPPAGEFVSALVRRARALGKNAMER